MQKSTLFSAAVLAAASLTALPMSARSGGLQFPPEVLPLPSMVSATQPAQGTPIFLDGSSTAGYPKGVGSITIVFTSAPEKNIDIEPGSYFEIYVDGADEPAEKLPAESACVDAMGYSYGGFTFKGNYTKKGIYHITIPEGAWLVNGTPNPAFALNYEITNDMVLTPEPGTYNELTDIEIIFPSSFETTYNGGIKFYIERTPDDLPLEVEKVEPSIEGEEQNTYILHLNNGKPINEPNIYILEIPNAAFTQKWYGPEFSKTEGVRTISSDAAVLKFYVPSIPVPGVSPEPGSTLLKFNKFTLEVSGEGDYVLVPNNVTANYLYPATEEWEVSTVPYARLYAPVDDNVRDNKYLDIVFTDALKADGSIDPDYEIVPPAGNYVLSLGAGAFNEFYAGGAPKSSSPYSYRYTIIADPTVTEIVLPGDNNKLDFVELRYPNASYVEPNPDCAQAIEVLDEDGNKVDSVEVVINSGGIAPMADEEDDYEGASVKIEFEPAIVEKGTYTIFVPRGYFTCDADYPSNEETIKFYVNGTLGIDTVNADNSSVDVYTTTGVCVLRGAAPEAVETLNPGIYVVNGKKLVVR